MSDFHDSFLICIYSKRRIQRNLQNEKRTSSFYSIKFTKWSQINSHNSPHYLLFVLEFIVWQTPIIDALESYYLLNFSGDNYYNEHVKVILNEWMKNLYTLLSRKTDPKARGNRTKWQVQQQNKKTSVGSGLIMSSFYL